jgi:hypothetical protein
MKRFQYKRRKPPSRHIRPYSELGHLYAQIPPRGWSFESAGGRGGGRFCRGHVIVARRSTEEEGVGGGGE